MNGIMQQWWRLGGVLGIAFIVLFIIGGFILQGESPTYNDPIAEIRAYWEDDGQTYLIGDYLIGLAIVLFFLPFLVCLRTLLGRAEGEPQIWSRVCFAGGLLIIAFSAAAAAAWSALAFGAENLDDESLLTLMYLDVGAWNAFPYAIGAFVGAASIVMIQTGVLWRWLGYLGLVVAIAALITPLGILDEDPEDIFDTLGIIPFLGLAIWLLLTSIGMLMIKAEPMPRVTVPTTSVV
jgi:hypothetical protein